MTNAPTFTQNENGTKYWYLNDKLHREDGPAVEYANGDKYWYLNDKNHREDGPAIECANGDKYWLLNGELLSFEDWCKAVNKTEKEIFELVMKYG